MNWLLTLGRDNRGAAAIELAFALPVLVLVISAVVQAGIYFNASADVRNALGEGVRFATLCVQTEDGCVPPPDEQVKRKMEAALLARSKDNYSIADPVDGPGYRELSITYSQKLNFILVDGPMVSSVHTKRAYIVS